MTAASRHYKDWLEAYCDFTRVTESPQIFHCFSGLSAISAALGRKCHLSMGHFEWYPNQYIILVAPPGVAQKSSTVSVAYNLLRRAGYKSFGPEAASWQGLFDCLADNVALTNSGVQYSAISIESSELGNFLAPKDSKMIDFLISLWDSAPKEFTYTTRKTAAISVQCPCLNLIGCTTPSWIASEIPYHMIGGGFISRCLFVYADRKKQLIAYPQKVRTKTSFESAQTRLVDDLRRIMKLEGEFHLSNEAMDWGEGWYSSIHAGELGTGAEKLSGYKQRKQAHAHKIAMCLSAARRSTLEITLEDLKDAVELLSLVEKDMVKVFQTIGKSPLAMHVEQILQFIREGGEGGRSEVEVRKYAGQFFPLERDWESIRPFLNQNCSVQGQIWRIE